MNYLYDHFEKKNHCPKCHFRRVRKDGFVNSKQSYECLNCGHKFVLQNTSWVENAYSDYTIHKQTYAELSLKYDKSSKTIRKYFDLINSRRLTEKIKPTTTPFTINLVFDTTFFKRKLGIMVFRANSSNLSWKYVDSEKLSFYLEELKNLVELGYHFKSFTIDGRRGVVQLLQKHFNTAPIQICIFHQVQIVNRYTTRNPKTECGKELRELILTLKTATKDGFVKEFKVLQDKYKDFLKERNELNQFQHRRLRSAIRSLKTNLPYLFTFQNYPELNIPNTTNSADGSFGQWKYKVRLHRHLRIDRMKQMIDEILK